MKKDYNKPPLSFQEQLEKLKAKGLVIRDEDYALKKLSQISYFRLSAYFLPYQSKKDKFNGTVDFKQIIDTYSFDRELRLLVFDCIERIEVAIRTQFIYQMAIHYSNSRWHDDKNLFIAPFCNKVGTKIDPYSDFQSIIQKAKTTQKPEVFIKHYTENYKDPSNPPAWMCFELLTIGELSNLYRGLKDKEDKKRIAKFFDLHPTVFTSWLHALTYVRNICAHHSRLWNKDLAVEPSRLKKTMEAWVGDEFNNNKRVFYFLCVLKYFLIRVNPSNSFTEKLRLLFEKYSNIPIQYLGIPSDKEGNLLEWEKQPLWQS